MNTKLQSSELILNEDGSVYHLCLQPEMIAPIVILVGDQGRVDRISRHFDQVLYKVKNREFVTHTGTYEDKKISVLSTGIGTDNIDIVMNELDALVNMDLDNRTRKSEQTSLSLVRVGTSGALQADIAVGSMVISQFALGLDAIMHFYDVEQSNEERELNAKINNHLALPEQLSTPYLFKADDELMNVLGPGLIHGITVTAPGFYAPQGRNLHPKTKNLGIREKLASFRHAQYRITNLEMESSAIYGFSKMMGHKSCTCCAILANRATGQFVKNHDEVVDGLIVNVLEALAKS